jgi:hypothetical protein
MANFGIGVESDGAPGGIAACSQQAGLKPVASPFGAIFTTILNRSGQDIRVFRLNNAGQRTSVSTPPAAPVGNDRSVRVLALRSSLIIVTDASDNCLEAILPGETTRTVTIRPPGGGGAGRNHDAATLAAARWRGRAATVHRRRAPRGAEIRADGRRRPGCHAATIGSHPGDLACAGRNAINDIRRRRPCRRRHLSCQVRQWHGRMADRHGSGRKDPPDCAGP